MRGRWPALNGASVPIVRNAEIEGNGREAGITEASERLGVPRSDVEIAVNTAWVRNQPRGRLADPRAGARSGGVRGMIDPAFSACPGFPG